MDYVILSLKLLLLAIAAFLTVAMADLRSNERSKLNRFLKSEKWIVRGIVVSLLFAVIVECFSFARDKQAAEEATRLAEGTAKDAANAAEKAGEAIEEINDVLNQVLRTAEPIEHVVVDVAFSLPLDIPAFAQYRSRLDSGVRELLRTPSRTTGSQANFGRFEDTIRYGTGRAAGVRIPGRLWLDSTHDLFRDAPLTIGQLELALYREPIDPQDFVLSRLRVVSTAPLIKRIEPDLGFAQVFQGGDGWILTSEVGSLRNYWLELRDWSPDRSTWHQNASELAFVNDLAGSQLFINFGGLGERDARIRAAFELTGVTLQINDRAVAISAENMVKHTVQDESSAQHGHPFWEYRFPAEPALIFKLPPNRPMRSQDERS